MSINRLFHAKDVFLKTIEQVNTKKQAKMMLKLLNVVNFCLTDRGFVRYRIS